MVKVLAALAVALMVGAFAFGIQDDSAEAGGRTMSQAVNAGWNCSIPPGEEDYHCFKKDPFSSSPPPTVQVLIFSGIDQSFEGTEILWRNDIYSGQPCPQDSLVFLPFGYTACHHYDRGH